MSLFNAYVKTTSFFKKTGKDEIAVYSSQAGFFIILSFFPFVMFLITMMKNLNIPGSVLDEILPFLLPDSLKNFILNTFDEMKHRSSKTVISFTAITTLWSSSKAMLAIIRGLNSVYGTNEYRGFIRLRAMAILQTFIFASALIITFILLVYGNIIIRWIGYKVPDFSLRVMEIKSTRTLWLFLILTLFFTLLFYIAPSKKQNLLPQFPGAVFSSGGWIIFSWIYSYYIENMGNFSYIYGSLTALALTMLWLYFCMYIMFIGAEINAQLFIPLYERRKINNDK